MMYTKKKFNQNSLQAITDLEVQECTLHYEMYHCNGFYVRAVDVYILIYLWLPGH